MLVCRCDQCSAVIERDDGDWFGVDWTPPATATVIEADEEVILTQLIELGVDHEFHLCSVDCLVAFAMNRAYATQPSEGTTT